jgi:2-polyprenyl-3-methyl-5-hydroxy-6-metoxy-1,4-benzoquinol methylase
MSYAQKVQEQIAQFQQNIDPLPLTESFHHWSHNFVRPQVLAEFGTGSITDFYAIPFAEHCRKKPMPFFVSLGSGDASNEIEIGKSLVGRRHTNFKLLCLDLIPEMVAQSNRSIAAAGLSHLIEARVFDVNRDTIDQPADAWMAHQSLHHFLELEKIFDLIASGMTADGSFLTMDMIGRNGHMRWPEVLQFVEAIWRVLPPQKKYNHQTKHTWENFINHDCSCEGFEGIRAQDILPLLTDRFRFTHFLGTGGLIDPFIDRGFCRNYDPKDAGDRLFIETLEALNSALLASGTIKPTIMFARMVHKDGSPQHPIVLKSIRHIDPISAPAAEQLSSVHRPCPVCGNKPVVQIGTLAKNFPGRASRSSFDLLQCSECEILYQSPLPTSDDFKSMYEEATQFTSPEYRDPEKIEGILNYYSTCCRQMLGLMNHPARPRILEVGAGLAWVCRSAKLINPHSITVAQDVSNECASECTWADAYVVATIDDPRIDRRGPYDIISMTHVIEHLPDPVAVLTRLRSLLTSEGCVFITCPHRPEDCEKSPSQSRWAAWSYNHVPGHLQYFSKEAMIKTANLAGLSLEHWTLHENGQAIEAILRPSKMQAEPAQARTQATQTVSDIHVHRFNSSISVYDPSGTFHIDLSEHQLHDHKFFIDTATARKVDSYQTFLRAYLGIEPIIEKRKTDSVNRFALNCELLTNLVPLNGVWIDLGAFGHDAVRVKSLRDDISTRLFALPGSCAKIVLDEAGIHYRGDNNTGLSVEIEEANFELSPLPLADGCADVVSAFEVVEHFNRGPQKFMLECNRILKQGGHLIFSTPNITSAEAISRAMLGESPNESRHYHRSMEMGKVHPIEFDYSQMHALLTANGFEIAHLVSVDLRPPDPNEVMALQLCESLHATSKPPTRHVHFGHIWYAVGKKIRQVTTPQYPVALFESPLF